MKGIQFLVDERGKKTAVLIDLKKNRSLWEDFFDRLLVQNRIEEPRESLESVEKRFRKQQKK